MSYLEGGQAGGVPSYSWEGQTFCSIQAFSWLDEAHLLQGGQPALLSPLIQMGTSPESSS